MGADDAYAAFSPDDVLWVAGAVVERPIGHVRHFGPMWIGATDEAVALERAEAWLERKFPEIDGWVRTFDVCRAPEGVLRQGLAACRRERARQKASA
jgi:hypothetical protein